MNKIVKSLITLGITSALSVNLISQVNAATYTIVDLGEISHAKYTYAQQQNSNGDMAVSATSLYNFPVQFDYFDDNDFDLIEAYALNNYLTIHSLDNIEDSDALRDGNPTANDLAWVVRWLQDRTSGKGLDKDYQKVGDSTALTNIDGVMADYRVWDVNFDGTATLTRSTVDIVRGITDNSISYGGATAPYLPSETFTDSNGAEHTFWLREHGLRGFYSYDSGAQVFEIIPLETAYVGGTSVITNVNKDNVAVGFSSYKVTQAFDDFINVDDNGCSNTDNVPEKMTLEACIQSTVLTSSSDFYHNMAFKTTLEPNGSPVLEQLGLLVTPHEDDERSYSSYALAINSQGVAVGYADGFDDETVTTPEVDERRNFHYAVVYKNGDVIDLSGEHNTNEKGNSRAYDINDTGIAVGDITKVVSGSYVKKFFYVDTSVEQSQIEMVTPEDYFSGSDSTARAINNSGLIVGEGEVETHNESNSNPRRTAAFVYNLHDNVFSNLNDLIPCDSRNTYDIIEARGINDNGYISATAVMKVERRDAKGELMLDSSGTALTEDVVRAISLAPISDTGEVCTSKQKGKIERQGASISMNSIWLFMALIGLRRQFFN